MPLNGYVLASSWTSFLRLRCRPVRNPLIPVSENPAPPLSPTHTNTRLLSTWRLNHAVGNAESTRNVPTVGSSAHHPGNLLLSLRTNKAVAISRSPVSD